MDDHTPCHHFLASRSPSPWGGGGGRKCWGRAQPPSELLLCIPECLQLRQGRKEALQQQRAGVTEVYLGQAAKARAHSRGFQVGCSSGVIQHTQMGSPREGEEPPKSSQWGHLGHPGVLPPLAKCDSLLLGEARRPEKVMLPQALLIPMLTISWIGQLLPCGLVGALGGDQRTQGPSWYFRVLT